MKSLHLHLLLFAVSATLCLAEENRPIEHLSEADRSSLAEVKNQASGQGDEGKQAHATGSWAGEERECGEMKLCWIPAGRFIMGSMNNGDDEDPAQRELWETFLRGEWDFTTGSPKREDNEGRAAVELSDGFWLGRYEVTQGQYQEIMGKNPSFFKQAGKTAPVEQVSWLDAMEFCRKLTERQRETGSIPEGWGYTLPTEAQWEYACRAGSRTVYSFGDDPARLGTYGWFKENSNKTPHPVGQKKRNAWGLFDMHGNVWEWVLDHYGRRLPGGKDPEGPATGEFRVYRGGGWVHSPHLCGSAYRYWSSPTSDIHYRGFRVALSTGAARHQERYAALRKIHEAQSQSDPAVGTLNANPLFKADAGDKMSLEGLRFTNSLGMKFVPMPGTSVYFCEHETRVMDYAAFATENPQVNRMWKNVVRKGHRQTGEHPVVNINWLEAKAFCAWLSQKEGKTYRLPTDHEWSIAVGIGARENPRVKPMKQKRSKNYPWGSDWPPPVGSGNFSGSETGARFSIEGYRDDYVATAPVKSFPPNQHGLHDLSGNVSEWCEDWASEKEKYRVMRGGSLSDYIDSSLRSSFRSGSTPSGRNSNRGFRCVVEGRETNSK